MTTPNFDKLFTAAALEMLAAFERSSSGNRPDEIGAPREKQFKNFLRDWLPEKYGISKGYILNAEKKVSRECDVVIFNSETCPKFYFDKDLDVRFFPKNEVYSSFEIKSTLNETELTDALDKIDSVKNISSYRSQWLFGDKEWEEHDAKLAEHEDEENFWGGRKKRIVDKEDFKDYKLKIKKTVEKYSDAFCGIFAYKSGRKLTLDSLREKLIALDNSPDIVVILNKGLLIKVDDFTIKRLRSITEKKAQYHFANDLDIFWQKFQLVGFGDRTEYLVLKNEDTKINLMYFYIFLIDFLNEFKKCPDSYAADIISVWKQE
jgi:hypothetical protein